MKRFMRVLAAGLICFVGNAAQAMVLTYTYQARVSSIVENAGPGMAFIDVTQSDFAGTPVAIGDIVTGSFRYDTSVALVSYQPPQDAGVDYRVYASGANDYITYVDKRSGLAFTSMPSLNWLGLNQVHDSVPIPGNYAADFFSMGRSADNDIMYASALMWFDDLYGNAFQSGAMPTQLDLAAFQFASVDGSFMRLSDRAYMSFSADISSLERVDLPEPSSALLFVIAAGGLFGLRRVRRA
jgi:hypothetical protein